jgi:AcrR family transcriptional regulator
MGTNKNLKKDRIKSYFVDAAKEIIIIEGVAGISVKKVSEKAGYSYATVYHYYQDLHALLWDVKLAMVTELRHSLTAHSVQEAIRAYVDYYLKYPNVFEFFYLYQLDTDKGNPQELFGMYDDISKEEMNGFASTSCAVDARMPIKTCIYAIHGLLLLYFSSNGMKKEDLYDDLNGILVLLSEPSGESSR